MVNWPGCDRTPFGSSGSFRTIGFRVLDVETWLPTRPGPTPLINDWDEARGGSALAFVQTFAWKPIDAAHRGLDVHFTMIAVRGPASPAATGNAP